MLRGLSASGVFLSGGTTVCPACELEHLRTPGGSCPNTNCPRHTVIDADFDRIFLAAHPYSLLSWAQGWTLFRAVTRAPVGAIAELGVYKGGSAMMLAAADPARHLHLFDTFTGHPAVWHRAHDRPGSHSPGSLGDTSVVEVAQRLTGMGAQVELYPGTFPLSFKDCIEDRFAVVHIDVDLWASAKAGLAIFGEALVPGGILVMDDFGTDECPGVKEAVMEYLDLYRERFIVSLTVYPTYQAILQKVSEE